MLEPITLKRRKVDYLAAIETEGWVTVNPRSHAQRYQLKDEYRAAGYNSTTIIKAGVVQTAAIPANEAEPLPVGHERENPDVLELLRKFSNRPTAESSGPSLR